MVLDVGLRPGARLVDDVVAADAAARLHIARVAPELMGSRAVDVLVELFLEKVGDLPGVETEVARVRREHALGVAALGHALEVALLESDEDILPKAEDT